MLRNETDKTIIGKIKFHKKHKIICGFMNLTYN